MGEAREFLYKAATLNKLPRPLMGWGHRAHPSRKPNGPMGCTKNLKNQIICRLTSKQGLDGEQDSTDIIGGWPLLLQDIKADVTMQVNIRMEAGSDELDSGGRVRVTAGELERQPVSQPLVHLQNGGAGSKTSYGIQKHVLLTIQSKKKIYWKINPQSCMYVQLKSKSDSLENKNYE